MVTRCLEAGISHPFGDAVWVSDSRELESACVARERVPREIPAIWWQVCTHTHGPRRDCLSWKHLQFLESSFFSPPFRDYTKPRQHCLTWFTSVIKKAIPQHKAWHYNQFAQHNGMPPLLLGLEAAGLGGSPSSKPPALESTLALSNTLQWPVHLQLFICCSTGFVDCLRVPYIKIHVSESREVYSAGLAFLGEILSSLYPWQERPFSRDFALIDRVEENLHIVSRGRLTSDAYQHFFVYSLQIQLWFLPVTQIHSGTSQSHLFIVATLSI